MWCSFYSVVLFAYSNVERLLGVEISAFSFLPETKVAEAWERYSQTLEPDRGWRGRGTDMLLMSLVGVLERACGRLFEW